MSKNFFDFLNVNNFGPNPKSGININKQNKPIHTEEIKNEETFDFSPYKEYPGPNPESGKDVRKK